MLKRHVLSIVIAISLLTTPLFAEEGMWLLSDIPKLPFDSMHAMGLQLSPGQVFNPAGGGIADAIVRVSGGTGSFVSENGLLVTNHHVAYRAIQRQSTSDNNYLTSGFYAASLDQEIPAFGYNVYITQSLDDVTDRVFARLSPDMSALERFDAIEKIEKEIVAEAEAAGDVECKVASMYGGKQYILMTYYKLRDVRIVFAPPRSIGDYGGETDNWMWPRHSGDFTFLRAYIGPDGKPADYSLDNVPYKPRTHLAVSTAGVREGDFTIVIGYPGNTTRYECSSAIDWMVNNYYPKDIQTRLDVIDIYESLASADPDVAIRLSSKTKGIYNYLKKRRGTLEGFERAHLLQHKTDSEQELETFIHRHPELKDSFGNVLHQLDSVYDDYAAWQAKDFVYSWLARRSDYLASATEIIRWVDAQDVDDMDRDPGFQMRDTLRNMQYLKYLQINMLESADRAILIHFLKLAAELPPDQRFIGFRPLFDGVRAADHAEVIAHYVDELLAGTKVGDEAERLAMYHETSAQLTDRHDTFIEFARALEADRKELRDREKAYYGTLTTLEPKLIDAYAAKQGGLIYPDANGTVRFNYGTVQRYSPRDAVHYDYITSLTGMIEKDQRVEPFDAPEEVKAAFAKGDFEPWVDPLIDDVPVNFLSTNDITNGNSGSPVMNGKGELIGLAFDGNYEAMTSDYQFDAQITRCINVDIRYALFLLQKVYHADRVFDELTLH